MDLLKAEELIEHILTYYEVPDKKRERIRGIALNQIKTRFLSGVNAYRYVSSLVETFLDKHRFREAPLFANEGESDYGNVPDLKTKLYLEGSLEVEALIPNLERHLESDDPDSLRDLFQRLGSSVYLGGSSEDVKRNLELAKSRVIQLRDIFTYKGRIRIPTRPIKSISFDGGLRIEFAPRSYNGDPLAFLRENQDVYGDLSHAELREFDRGLRDALYRQNQIHLVFPPIPKKVPPPKSPQKSLPSHEVIVALHSKYNGNSTKAAKALGVSRRTIQHHWWSARLSTKGKRFKRKRFNLSLDEELIVYNNGFVLESLVLP